MNNTPIRRRVIIPKHVRDLFWEYPKKSLTWQQDSELIIRKVLESGQWDSVKWLLATAGLAWLRDWMIEHRGAGLEPKRLRFWQQVLNLHQHDVDQWIMVNHTDPWQNRRMRKPCIQRCFLLHS